jgi:hypothetical protein
MGDLLSSFAAWLYGLFTGFLEWIGARINEFAIWLWQALQDAALWVWRGILDAMATLLESLPIPEWAQAENALAGIPCEVAYFVEPLQLGFGIAVVGSAIFLRFLIRRLPIVG